MGVQIKELLVKKEIKIDDLKAKKLAVDAHNTLYQFLTTIRQRDGTPLMDSQGRVTSHLSGVFNRMTKLIQKGIKAAFVFDGDPPKLKQEERERRKELKIEAEKKYKVAVQKKDIDSMKKYAARTTRLSAEAIEEAKELISALGLPIVQAPSEGEAQAAHMTKKGDVYACVSQDFDTLVHGSPKLVRNLSITGRKKKGMGYEAIKPEMFELSSILNDLGIDNDQLIAIAMLVGTDYNPGGVKGIGPKNALKLVKQHKSDLDSLFKGVKWESDASWTEIFYLIKKMPVRDDYKLEWKDIDVKRVVEILVEEHDFSGERVEATLDKFSKEIDRKKQKGLGEFF